MKEVPKVEFCSIVLSIQYFYTNCKNITQSPTMKHSLSPLYINLTKAEDTSVCLRMHISTKVNLKKKKSLIQQHKQK